MHNTSVRSWRRQKLRTTDIDYAHGRDHASEIRRRNVGKRRHAPQRIDLSHNSLLRALKGYMQGSALPEHLLHQRQLAIDIVGADAVAFEGHAQRVPQAKHHRSLHVRRVRRRDARRRTRLRVRQPLH